jgi:hypothetical protein
MPKRLIVGPVVEPRRNLDELLVNAKKELKKYQVLLDGGIIDRENMDLVTDIHVAALLEGLVKGIEIVQGLAHKRYFNKD